jgi:SNF2 family DNA or RNA helicase
LSSGLASFRHFNSLSATVLFPSQQGLGKTVEAIGGAVLRNALAGAKGLKKRPTAIVAPNDAVLLQWRDTLIRNGVPEERIYLFQKAQDNSKFDEGIFLLMTRYALQSEVKELFDYIGEYENQKQRPRSTSVLFPHLAPDNLYKLWMQYMAKKGKLHLREKTNYAKKEGEYIDDCVSRLLALCVRRICSSFDLKELVFETVIIDEAHMLKNRCTYSSMGAALMGAHALRSVPLSGTPYK